MDIWLQFIMKLLNIFLFNHTVDNNFKHINSRFNNLVDIQTYNYLNYCLLQYVNEGIIG